MRTRFQRDVNGCSCYILVTGILKCLNLSMSLTAAMMIALCDHLALFNNHGTHHWIRVCITTPKLCHIKRHLHILTIFLISVCHILQPLIIYVIIYRKNFLRNDKMPLNLFFRGITTYIQLRSAQSTCNKTVCTRCTYNAIIKEMLRSIYTNQSSQ